MARPAGFEPTTPWFVARYSIQLSYGRKSSIIAGLAASPVAAALEGRSPGSGGRTRAEGLRHSVHAFQAHDKPSQPQSTATGHARMRGNHAESTPTEIVNIATTVSRPASVCPSVRRLVSAAPSALPTLTAPAAARPALPDI